MRSRDHARTCANMYVWSEALRVGLRTDRNGPAGIILPGEFVRSNRHVANDTSLTAQAVEHLWMTQLGQRARLDLAHTLTRDAKLAAHLFERIGAAIA